MCIFLETYNGSKKFSNNRTRQALIENRPYLFQDKRRLKHGLHKNSNGYRKKEF